ncbi:MAG: c-type cytochrome [Acidobacteriota bacterium]|jgi:hypothetical protein|nr:MAG: c-type cytochrome [Acidobacteriota bacterium]
MKKSLVFVLAGAVWLTGAAVMAQGPAGGGQQAPMDLKVLPKTWSRQQVGALMQAINTSLGVQCSHCHAEDPDAPPPLPGQNPRLDYALDTKPEKEIARAMIKLTMDLNAQARQPGDDPSVEKISCYTCHRGKATPDKEPEGGWGRGSFSLTEAGPVVPQRGRGAGRGGPGGGN